MKKTKKIANSMKTNSVYYIKNPKEIPL